MPRQLEEVMTELDAVLPQLSDGRGLEAQLNAWERGTALAREADAILAAVEKRIEIVLADGEVKTFEEAE